MGSDTPRLTVFLPFRTKFQSTLPAWGATRIRNTPTVYRIFQSTLPAWGATLSHCKNILALQRFQSTLPAWGATHNTVTGLRFRIRFQSTLPAWGATANNGGNLAHTYFNPRSPHGERPRAFCKKSNIKRFQSTLPAWGATFSMFVKDTVNVISIHAPRMGSDSFPPCLP